MLKIIVSAYAMCPGMGSEQGMAWSWCSNLAKHCELFIITESEYKDKILSLVKEFPYGENMHFYWNEVSPTVRNMCWNQGDWRFYYYYRKWQLRTADIARDIVKKIRTEQGNTTGVILHQLNMIGFREPGYLWKVAEEYDIPFVWGPVDAKDGFPMAYAYGSSLKIVFFLMLKNLINRFQLKYGFRTHKAADVASCVIGASSNSVISFKKYFNKNAVLINETGCRVAEYIYKENRIEKDTLDVLWVGKIDFRKQLALALRVVAESGIENIKLHIVGGGDDEPYRSISKKLNISDKCKWHGILTHDNVQILMQQCDLLLFTSVAEGTPHVVLEAIANSLPVICFDTCGQGDCVNNAVGRKVPLTNPKQSVIDFAVHLKYFAEHRDELRKMSEACIERAKELSWENKISKLMSIYEKI